MSPPTMRSPSRWRTRCVPLGTSWEASPGEACGNASLEYAIETMNVFFCRCFSYLGIGREQGSRVKHALSKIGRNNSRRSSKRRIPGWQWYPTFRMMCDNLLSP
eukprot:1861334-Pyramimonas_sp.AAC.3